MGTSSRSWRTYPRPPLQHSRFRYRGHVKFIPPRYMSSFLEDDEDKEKPCAPESDDGYFPGKENWVKASKYPVPSDVESGVVMDEDEVIKQRPDDVEQGEVGDSDDDEEDYGILTYIPNYQKYKKSVLDVMGKDGGRTWRLALSVLLLVLYFIYFIAVLITNQEKTENYWCDGAGFLIIITLFVAIGLVYFQIIKRYFGRRLYKQVIKPVSNFCSSFWEKLVIRIIVYAVIVLAIIIFLSVDASHEPERLRSISGLLLLILFGFVFSKAPRKINWSQVLWGMGLQFALGIIILRWDVGKGIFKCAGSKISTFLAFTDDGSGFVFGYLAVGEKTVFAFQVLCVIMFFGFVVQILYYLGAMQWIVLKLGWLLQSTIGTTACESVNAAANIFLGQTEAPLIIKPYFSMMTKSELHAVMTGGFATIAGSVLAAYITFQIDAAHLLSASVMSAPAALAYAKLFYPETGKSRTSVKDIQVTKGTESNLLHAAVNGVTSTIPLVASIAANLVAFVAFVAFFNAVFNWSCILVGAEDGMCTLENVMGYVFMPLAYTMGVPWEECEKVGELIGTKTIVNEFVAYLNLAAMKKENLLSERAQVIATYALCGFSNIASIGINLGSLGAMAPDRRGDLAAVAVRAMIAGSAACFMTACTAGMLISGGDVALQAVNAVNGTVI
ncbi:putative transporter YutK isoform X2 [Oratosquilla oratoria]|uniref:putative transporter YutK isoform X2 n=1 Tax=Oratosquilla oratoria TaxID=337810 RepID=UPI003F75AA49